MKLFNDDCLKVLPSIPNKSIDLILTDPPYGTTPCKWDSVIPLDKMWFELKRIIKNESAIILFGTEPFSSNLRLSNTDWFKYDWIWEKPNGANFLVANYQPLKVHEIISVFGNAPTSYSKNKPMMRNLKESLITLVLYLMRKLPRFKYETRHHLQALDQQSPQLNLDYPNNVLRLKKKIVRMFKQKEK